MKQWQIVLLSFFMVGFLMLAPDSLAAPENRISSPELSSFKTELEQQNPDTVKQATDLINGYFDSKNISIEILTKASDKFGEVIVLGIDEQHDPDLSSFNEQAIIWWDKDGHIKLDQLEDLCETTEPGDAEEYEFRIYRPMPDQVVLGENEVGVVYNGGYGGNVVRPIFILYRLEAGCCELVWKSPDNMAWYNIDGSISFPDGTPDKLVIEGTTWLNDCILDRMIETCHAGPHRLLSSTWVRKGDTYVATSWDQARDTPYNTLVNFMFGLLTHDDEHTDNYIANDGVLKQAKASGFKVSWDSVGGTDAIGSGWMIEESEPGNLTHDLDSSVPYVIIVSQQDVMQWGIDYFYGQPQGPSQRWKITTICVDGYWKVNGIEKIR